MPNILVSEVASLHLSKTMHLLVSFCNLKAPALPALGLLDVHTLDFQVLTLPAELERCTGMTGVVLGDSYLYLVAQPMEGQGPFGDGASSVLLIFDRRNLSLQNHHVFRAGVDVHSLAIHAGSLHAVSTGTDEVLELRMRGDQVVSEVCIWRPIADGPRDDVHHLNALGALDGDLIVSGFGKKEGERWSSARDGFIMNISRGKILAQGIDQPHSLAVINRTLVYCESRTRAVRVIGEGRVQHLPGYARGLCTADGGLFAATSIGRHVSKSTGAVNNPAETGSLAGRCTISRLSPESFEIERTIDLGLYAHEIYDLLPIEDVRDWPIASEISWRDTALRSLTLRVDQRTSWAKQSSAVVSDLQAQLQSHEALQQEVASLRQARDQQESKIGILATQIDGLRAELACSQSTAQLAFLRYVQENNPKLFDYQVQIQRIQAFVRESLPVDATVLVVSKGDENLLNLDGRLAWHFPRTVEGAYAGGNPDSSLAAIAQLEALRIGGADFFLIPAMACWWLDHYTAFTAHLRRRYRELQGIDGVCRIFDLRELADPAHLSGFAALEGMLHECERRTNAPPAILDWGTSLQLERAFPQHAVFAPPEEGHSLPYLDNSVEVVVIPGGESCLAEARRVASAAVVTTSSKDGNGTPEFAIEWRLQARSVHAPSVSLILGLTGTKAARQRHLASLACSLPVESCGEILCLQDDSADTVSAATLPYRSGWTVKFMAETGMPASVASFNRAAAEAQGDVLVFFHRSAVPLDGWLPPLVDILDNHPTVGSVGAKVIALDGRLEHAGGVVFADATTTGFGSGDYQVEDPLYAYVREVDFGSDVLHAVSRSLFDELGGFDSPFGSVTLACADFCFRARSQGRSALYQPASVAVTIARPELCNGTSGDRGIFQKKWGHILQHQPTPRHWRDRDTWLSLAAPAGLVPEESK